MLVTFHYAVIIYVNDLSSVINNSHILGYADDTKCYKHMVTQFDQQLLHNDLNAGVSQLISPLIQINAFTYVLTPKLFKCIFLVKILYPLDQFKMIWE